MKITTIFSWNSCSTFPFIRCRTIIGCVSQKCKISIQCENWVALPKIECLQDWPLFYLTRNIASIALVRTRIINFSQFSHGNIAIKQCKPIHKFWAFVDPIERSWDKLQANLCFHVSCGTGLISAEFVRKLEICINICYNMNSL